MPTDLNEQLDLQYQKQMLNAAVNWAKLENVIGGLDMASEINLKAVKVINQGGHYLLVLTALVQGVAMVKYRDVAHLKDVAAETLKMLTIEDWKADKYAKSARTDVLEAVRDGCPDSPRHVPR